MVTDIAASPSSFLGRESISSPNSDLAPQINFPGMGMTTAAEVTW